MKLDQYTSPSIERPQNQVDVAVSVSNLEDLDLLKSELKEKLMRELKERIEEERKEQLVDQETFTGSSLTKHEKQEKFVQFTPVKSQEKLMSKFTNSLSAVYSSAKKLFSRSQVKNKSAKKFNLTIRNLNSEYESLFSMGEKVTQQEVSIQTSPNFSFHYECETEVYPTFDEDTSSTNDIVNTVSFCIEKKKVKVEFEEVPDVDTISETKETESCHSFSKKKRNVAKKPSKREKKKKERKEMVAKAREEAARICREKSRTPLKSRLRKYKK